MPYLIDTNILSELRKGKKCDPNVLKWAKDTTNDRHYISVLSLGEIRKGIERLRRKSLDQCLVFENWLITLRTEYETNILTVTDRIGDQWGHMMAKQTKPAIDGLLAATALTHKLTMVTRNVNDFKDTGIEVINPFQYSKSDHPL